MPIMYKSILLTLALFFCSVVFCDLYISDEEYKKLPVIYHIDPFKECIKNPDNYYCRVNIELQPINKNNASETWKLITKTKLDSDYYNHDKLQHALCLKKNEITMLSKIYTKKFQNQGLEANITSIECNHQAKSINLRIIDLIVLFVVLLYICLTIKATFSNQTTLSKYVKPFSIQHNLNKLKIMYNNPGQQFQAIQSMRFYTTVVIVMCHTYCSFVFTYLEDTKYIEEFAQNPIKHGLRILFVFLVQAFFLLSGWLLSYNSFKLFYRNPDLSALKYFCLTALNRYIRIIPPVLVIITGLSTFWLPQLYDGPIKNIFVDFEYWNCQKNWWVSLLFISNHYNRGQLCFSIGWYLAADFQLYLFSLIALIIIWKLPNHRFLLFTGLIFAGIIGQALVIYINDLDVIYRLFPKQCNVYAVNSFLLSVVYMSTYTNFTTYMLGLAFGYAFFLYEQKQIPPKISYIFMTCFISFPVLTLFLASFKYSRLIAPIMGSILKPIYGLGIGLGLLAMLKKNGGIIKKIFELKAVAFLGNITFSTYVIHYPVVLRRAVTVQKPLSISNSILVFAFVQDIIVAFAVGFLCFLLIEMPFSQIQSMVVPKLGQKTSKKIKKAK